MIYKLHSNCILTKGAARSTIVDLQNQKMYHIGNDLASLFESDSYIDSININKTPYNDFIRFLEDEDLILILEDINELEKFPPLNMDWDFPGLISNCIVDFDQHTVLDLSAYSRFFADITELGCIYTVIRVYNFIEPDFIYQLLQVIEATDGLSYELYLISDIRYKELIINFAESPKLQKIFFHTHVGEPFFKINNVYFLENHIQSENECGVIKDYYFSINIPHFTESQRHNTCLNRKVSIDSRGNIKQCPSMTKIFGNIQFDRVYNIINNRSFNDIWNVNKNQIEVCKVCEYRHVCTDCRAYVSEPNNILSKPLKCNYNPYTLTWEK